MQQHGWRIVPVNPRERTILGETVYRTLAEVREQVGLVDVFRPSEQTPDIARQAVAAGATALWLQLHIASDEARRIAEDAGLLYVENRCLIVEQRRLRLGAPACATAVLGAARQETKSMSWPARIGSAPVDALVERPVGVRPLLGGVHRDAERSRPAAQRVDHRAHRHRGRAARLPARRGDDHADGPAVEVRPRSSRSASRWSMRS